MNRVEAFSNFRGIEEGLVWIEEVDVKTTIVDICQPLSQRERSLNERAHDPIRNQGSQ